MNIDLSKENIQPLRSGRNASQLELALQAETNATIRRELQLQRERFETAIRTYQGDDSLEPWFQYIYFVEQNYPKNGHEGNLGEILERCLKIFENDPRYRNDRRFCRLWIKYIDLQASPIEVYQMLHKKNMFVGCADFYKAWSYYYEVVGDFKNANVVIGMGKDARAQPYEDLEAAYQNLLIAAGVHVLHGPNQRALMERREALTSLPTSMTGQVGVMRIGEASTVLPGTSGMNRRNVGISVYKGPESMVPIVPSESIITTFKRQEAPKENTMKPGPWNVARSTKRRALPKTPKFKVHIDEEFPPETKEVFHNWVHLRTLPEVRDSRVISMYPKALVYSDPNTEYSLEELRAPRYCVDDDEVENKKQESLEHRFPSENGELMKSFHGCDDELMDSESLDQPNTGNHLVNPDRTSPLIKQVMQGELQIQNVWSTSDMEPSSVTLTTRPTSLNPEFRREVTQPKVSAMKTPFKILSADDLCETGSRGGCDTAGSAAQPIDSANVVISSFEADTDDDDDDVIFIDSQPSIQNNCEPVYAYFDEEDEQAGQDRCIDESVNTQMFSFNIKGSQVSTPKKIATPTQNRFQSASVRRPMQVRLDHTKDNLDPITEESKSYRSTSSSGKLKSPTTNEDDHSNYLAQNSLANEALRKSLLGDLLPICPEQPVIAVSAAAPSSSTYDACTLADRSHLNVPSDPFRAAEINKLLRLIDFPGPNVECDYHVVRSLPKVTGKRESHYLGQDEYIIEKMLGKGNFGTVFKALQINTNKVVALKCQKPPNKWEFYICREIHDRLRNSPMKERFMNILTGYYSDSSSVLVCHFMPHGSLLDLVNMVKQKTGKAVSENLCIYFASQMLHIIEALHQVKIIHADIKPDNFLIELTPDSNIELVLIDFGCSIDMSLYPPDTYFTKKVLTDSFVCCEMRENRPWNYHTDFFCVAATTYVLLFDKYMEILKKYDVWTIKEKIPRYMHSELWNKFFITLLNHQKEVPSLKIALDEALSGQYKKFTHGMKTLVNMIKNQ